MESKKKTTRYYFEIPYQMRKEFAAVCNLHGMFRVDVLLRFMKKYVENDAAIHERMKEKYLEKDIK